MPARLRQPPNEVFSSGLDFNCAKSQRDDFFARRLLLRSSEMAFSAPFPRFLFGRPQ